MGDSIQEKIEANSEDGRIEEICYQDHKDSQLVELSKKENREAFLELVGRYTEKVQRLAMRITRNDSDSEEVVQDVFITLFTKLHSFQGKSAFSSWLYRVTSNAAFMKLRSRRKHSATSYEEMTAISGGFTPTFRTRSDATDINFISVRHELRALLEEALDALPDEYRTIFILRDVDGLSNQEAGEVLGLTVPAVKSRLHRARLLLRKKLKRYHQDFYSSDFIQYGKGYYAKRKKNSTSEIESIKAA